MPFVPTLIGVLGLACGVLFFVRRCRISARSPITWQRRSCSRVPPRLRLLFHDIQLRARRSNRRSRRRSLCADALAMELRRVASGCLRLAIGIYQATLLLTPVLFGFYLVAQIISVPQLMAGCCSAVLRLLRRHARCLRPLRVDEAGYAARVRRPVCAANTGGYVGWRPTLRIGSATLRRTSKPQGPTTPAARDYYLYELRIVAVLFWMCWS